jgi:tRNA (pseudouridine54-N1)-methyltransferase
VRRFILVAHDARTSPKFSLDDLPGTGGRMDLVARCATAALLVSHGVRFDTEFLVVLLGPPTPPRTVRFVGAEIRSLNPDERSTAALIRKALAEEGNAERQAHPGVYVSGRSLEGVLAEIRSPIVALEEKGDDLRGAPVPADATFVLSDHLELTPGEDALVRGRTGLAVSVGPIFLQADQVISIVHNELDRRA